MKTREISVLLVATSLSVGVIISASTFNSEVKQAWTDSIYECALPDGYHELADICQIAVNASSDVSNTYTVRGTVTRSLDGNTYIQRVNQTNKEIDSLLLRNCSTTYTSGNVLDISGGKLNNDNGLPYLDASTASISVTFNENTKGYDPTIYDDALDFYNHAFDNAIYTYPYSRYVELYNVSLSYEVGDSSTFTLRSVSDSNIKITGQTDSDEVKALLDDYYLRDSNIDIKGVLSKSGNTDVLKILQTSDVSIYQSPLRNVQNTTILQAWNWSLTNITNELENIKNAGFKTIQVSPLQPMKDPRSSQSWTDAWWKLYQPYGFEIASTSSQSVIGTKSELQTLTARAKEMGINIIVDVVCNHLAGDSSTSFASGVSLFEKDIVNNNLYHSNCGSVSDGTYQGEVQGYLGNYPDLKTESTIVQNRVIHLLKEYIDCGVAGFRFDAAKHIETPDDTSYSSNFWSNVLGTVSSYASTNYSKTPYYYGEVLGVHGSRSMSWYTKYMSVSDAATRDYTTAVNNGNISQIGSYGYNLSGSQVVLWPESHDNYVSENSGNLTSQFNINKAYAMQAGRKDASALFLARPASNSTIMGNIGSTAYKSDKVVSAANKFHNELVDASEYISKQGGYYINVRKGDTREGVMIANISENGTGSININVDSNYMISDGNYTDLISGNTITVSGGYVPASFGDYGVMILLKVSENSSISGYGLKINNRTLLAVEQDGQDYSGRTQYKITRQSFKTGDSVSLYNFSTGDTWVIDVDPYSFGGDSGSSTKWNNYLTKNASTYTVKQDFSADIYIKLKYNDDQIYFDLSGLSLSSYNETITVGNNASITVSNWSGDTYSVTSQDTNIATCLVNDNIITVTAVAVGSTTITVSDGVVTRYISITVNSYTTYTITSLPNWIRNDNCVIFAWAWGDSNGGDWYSCNFTNSTTITVDLLSDSNGMLLVRCIAGTTTPNWGESNNVAGRIYNKTEDITFTDGVVSYTSPNWVSNN